VLAWSTALFRVPNLIVVSAVSFDMNKYFQIMWSPVAITAAWLVRRWPPPVVVALIAACALSPLLVAAWHVGNETVTMSVGQERAAQRIARDTPERPIFVTDAYINSPVDLAGRLRVTSLGPYVANLGFNPDQRATDVHSVYCDGVEQAARIMARYGATCVPSSGGLLECSGHQPTACGTSALFDTVYASDGTEVWRLRNDP
jgi:uncharacterized membrane protein